MEFDKNFNLFFTNLTYVNNKVLYLYLENQREASIVLILSQLLLVIIRAVPKPNFFPIPYFFPIPILPIPKNYSYSIRKYFKENDGNFNLLSKMQYTSSYTYHIYISNADTADI